MGDSKLISKIIAICMFAMCGASAVIILCMTYDLTVDLLNGITLRGVGVLIALYITMLSIAVIIFLSLRQTYIDIWCTNEEKK